MFSEGAVPQLTDINGNPEPMHMIGLLNAWLRQGMATMEPQLWNGCLNGKGSVRSSRRPSSTFLRRQP